MTNSELADLTILLAERAKPHTVGKLGALADWPVNDLAPSAPMSNAMLVRIAEIIDQPAMDAIALGLMGMGQ